MTTNIKTFSVLDFDAHVLADANYDAKFRVEVPPVAGSSYSSTQRANAWPLFGSTKLEGRVLPLTIEIKKTGTGTAGEILKWFDTAAGLKVLTVKDNVDSTEWFVYAKVLEIPRAFDTLVDVNLYVPDPIWIKETATTVSWNVTATGDTKAIAVGGTRNTRPVITINPQVAKGAGYEFRRWCPVYNPINAAQMNYGFDLVDGLFDTATIVSAGDMQADGDDLRVICNGVEVDRWLSGINTANTKIWARIDFIAGTYLYMDGAIGAGAITTLSVKKTAWSKTMLTRLGRAANKIVVIKTGAAIEAFKYTGVDLIKYQLTGVKRAQKGLAAAAHSDNDIIRHIPYDIWIMWNNAAVSAPDTDDTRKPMFTLASTNTSWVWTDYYDSTAPNRPGTWKRGVLGSVGKQSDFYTANRYTDADPASEMGMTLRAFKSGATNVWKAETGTVAWWLTHAGGFTHVTTSGEKYRSSSSWPAAAVLQKSNDSVKWAAVWNEATPASAASWTACTNTGSISLSGTFKAIRYALGGTIAAIANNAVYMEVDSITATLDSAKVPVTLFAYTEAQDTYYLAVRLTNSATGDYMDVTYGGKLDEPIVIDCELMTVTYNGDMRIPGAVKPSNPDTWFEFSAGVTNTITYDDASTNDVDVTFVYRERSV